MADLIEGIRAETVRANLSRVRDSVGPGVEILAATKYVPLDDMGVLAEAGIEIVGENRLQDLEAKQECWRDAFTWDFIGSVQSRKIARIAPLVRLIHSISSESSLQRLAQLEVGTEVGLEGGVEILVQVNVAGEDSKAGIEPGALGAFIEACPVSVSGLSTMPPFATDPEQSRPHFARLAELAAEHGLSRLSMGTSQDWQVAVAEGATTIRLGSTLFR